MVSLCSDVSSLLRKGVYHSLWSLSAFLLMFIFGIDFVSLKEFNRYAIDYWQQFSFNNLVIFLTTISVNKIVHIISQIFVLGHWYPDSLLNLQSAVMQSTSHIAPHRYSDFSFSISVIWYSMYKKLQIPLSGFTFKEFPIIGLFLQLHFPKSKTNSVFYSAVFQMLCVAWDSYHK